MGMILPTWLDHIEKYFCYKKGQFQMFCLCVENQLLINNNIIVLITLFCYSRLLPKKFFKVPSELKSWEFRSPTYEVKGVAVKNSGAQSYSSGAPSYWAPVSQQSCYFSQNSENILLTDSFPLSLRHCPLLTKIKNAIINFYNHTT